MEEISLRHNPTVLDIPDLLDNSVFFEQIVQLCVSGYFPLFYFGTSKQELLCGMGKGEQPLIVLRTSFPPNNSYPALTTQIPAFHIFERELFEEHQILALGHPWLKPVRYPCDSQTKPEDYPFFSSDSSVLHEVGVGPVHAGVIEPGHFRFICQGETVEHLEIQLGYQHRGVCKMLTEGDIRSKICLAEAIAGDSAISHALAYCNAVEALCNTPVSGIIQTIRYIALELERIGMHLADLSALSGDIAYLSGRDFFAALRTTIINSSLAICGSRFGKRWLKPGGINYGISKEQNALLRKTLAIAEKQIVNCAEALFSDAGVLNRFDSTGTLSLKTVQELGMSGITAKASGLVMDARKDFPLPHASLYQPIVCSSGDVYARAWVRYKEILQSLGMIDFMLSIIPAESLGEHLPFANPQPDKLSISIVEGWRGRIVHIIKTDHQSATELYKIYDPSLPNWFGLALAVREEGISDFPLCNKSFDLSYCGADL